MSETVCMHFSQQLIGPYIVHTDPELTRDGVPRYRTYRQKSLIHWTLLQQKNWTIMSFLTSNTLMTSDQNSTVDRCIVISVVSVG
jgi:hypothetical protein